jgi:hypothetical protein
MFNRNYGSGSILGYAARFATCTGAAAIQAKTQHPELVVTTTLVSMLTLAL